MASLLRLAASGAGKSVWRGTKASFQLATGGLAGRMAVGGAVGGGAGFFGTDYQSPSLRMGAVFKGAAFGAALGGATWAVPRGIKGAWRANMALGRRSLVSANRIGKEFARTNPFTGQKMYAGGASTLTDISFGARFGKSPLGTVGRWGMQAGKAFGERTLRAGVWAFEHPMVALGGGAAAVGGFAYFNRETPSPTMTGAVMNVDYNQQAIAANELQAGMLAPTGMVGTAPQMMGRMHRAMIQSTYGLTQGLHRGRHGS